jgi:uncharacterized protein
MSEEDVEIVRRAYAAFNEGNLDAALAAMDPDIEWNASDVFFDVPRTYRGRPAWQEEFLRDLMQIFETYRGEPEKLLDAGEQVVAVVWVGGRGRRSGADTVARVAHVFAFRDDKVVRFTELRDVDEALAAVGLAE